MKQEIITVDINRLNDWYTATSTTFEGFFMTWPDKEEMLADLSDAIKALYEERNGVKAEVNELPPVNVASPSTHYFVVQSPIAA